MNGLSWNDIGHFKANIEIKHFLLKVTPICFDISGLVPHHFLPDPIGPVHNGPLPFTEHSRLKSQFSDITC